MAMSSTTPPEARRSRRRENLKRMFATRSIVFFGGRSLVSTITDLRTSGFDGDIWVVNPIHSEIGGITCLASISDLPAVPDTAWIEVSAKLTVQIVRELAEMGVPGAVCYAAGFSEAGDVALEQALVDAAGDMAILGPNCIGLANFLDNVQIVKTGYSNTRPTRGVAVIAQSGTITGIISHAQRSIQMSHMLSLGNQAAVDVSDGIEVLIEDPRVDAVAIYVEGIRDPEAFARAACRAFELDKPIVRLRTGESTLGQAVALSHTGALSGTVSISDAFFRRLGVIQVDTFSQFIEITKMLAASHRPGGNRVAIETCSGSDAGYCADLAERNGLCLPQPNDAVKSHLQKVIPPIATPRNPLDVTMIQWGDRTAQATSLTTLLEQPADLAALVMCCPSNDVPATYQAALDAMIDVRKSTSLPCAVISNIAEGLPKPARETLIQNGIMPLQGIEDAFACIGHLARHSAWRAEILANGGPQESLSGLSALVPDPPLDETTSKSLLRGAGVPVPKGYVVHDTQAALEAASEIGYPVVLKGHGPALVHKSELNVVTVNVTDATSLRIEADRVIAVPGVTELLIEDMVTDSVAELIIGITRDPTFGLSLTLGAGGVLVEVLDDARQLLLPTSRADIESALADLRIYPLLTGFRGRPAGDIDAVLDCIVAVSNFALSRAVDLFELDINPLIIRPTGEGVFAVDAVLRLGHKQKDTSGG